MLGCFAGLLIVALPWWIVLREQRLPGFSDRPGAYWPDVDFAEGLLRSTVGLGSDRAQLDLSAAAVHVAHRAAAIAPLYLGWFSLHLLRVATQENLGRYGMLSLVMLSFADAFGIMEAVGGMPCGSRSRIARSPPYCS